MRVQAAAIVDIVIQGEAVVSVHHPRNGLRHTPKEARPPIVLIAPSVGQELRRAPGVPDQESTKDTATSMPGS